MNLPKKLSKLSIIRYLNIKTKNIREMHNQKRLYIVLHLKSYPTFINLYLFGKLIIGGIINKDVTNEYQQIL